jgi:hypothetical protein
VVLERGRRVKRRRDSGEEEGAIVVAVLVSEVKGRNQRRRFPVEEVTDGEEDADGWAPPVRGREGKMVREWLLGRGVDSVLGRTGRFGPISFLSSFLFLLSFYSFLFSKFFHNFGINNPNLVKPIP